MERLSIIATYKQTRFSEDLDFSTDRAQIPMAEVRQVFTEVPYLTIKKDFQSDATIKIEKLLYTGPLLQPNSLKIEIDNKQIVLLPAKTLRYNNVWGLDFQVKAMDVREIAAEKIRAMSERARYRDYYDFLLIVDAFQPDLTEVISYVSQKEIRTEISKENILRNWMLIGSQKSKEMDQTYYAIDLDDARVLEAINLLPFDRILPPGK